MASINSQHFNCNLCNYNCAKQRDYNRHLLTTKHKNAYMLPKKPTTFICDCGNIYRHRQSLYKHKSKCYIIHNDTQPDNVINTELLLQTQFEQQKEELLKQFELERQQFKKEKEELQKQVEIEKNRKTIETQHNNNLNIQINAFGCENLEYITDKFKIKCLNQIYKSIPEMVAKIHFNTKYPENHNIKIANKKLPQASIMTNDHKWRTVDKKTAISSIVNKSFGIMEETFEEHKDKLTDHKRHNYEKYQDKFNNNDKELHKQIETEVEYMVVDKTRQ
jgi:hypothetical protein